MVLLLSVAIMAVAVASWIIATTFRIRIRDTRVELAQARQQIVQCAQRLQQAEDRLRTQSDHDQARWAEEFETVRQQVSAVARDAARLSRHLDGVRACVRAQLEHDVVATRDQPGYRVLPGGIATDPPAVAGAVARQYEAFLGQLPLHTLFLDAGRYYLLWRAPDGQAPEQRLEELLRAAPGGDAGAGDGERDGPVRGVAELRGLLLALYRAGPGVLQAGPLVVVRTADQLVAAVLSAGEAGLLDGHATLPAPEECRSLLKALGDDRLADLGAWAGGQSP